MSENKQKTMVQEVPLTDDMFERIGTEGLSGEDIGKQSLTYWADVWRRFRSNKMAILGLILLIAVICLLFIGPTLSGKDYQFIDASIKIHLRTVNTGLVPTIWVVTCLPVYALVDEFPSILVCAVLW